MISITIDKGLSLEDFKQLLFTKGGIIFSEGIVERVERNFAFLKNHAENKIIYGINTGLGPMAQYKIDDEHRIDLQLNLIRSHSAGIVTRWTI
jgi:histidine ammonia-lyase